jgi:copper(I)-binding protein
LIPQPVVARTLVKLGLVIAVSVGLIQATNAQQRESHVVIDNAWVRAMPPTQSSTAGYLTVFNGGDSVVQIIAASLTPVADVEMHNSIEVDGLMRMERIHKVKLGPGEKIDFTPGGKHLMIMGLDKMPAPGDTVELCLEFDTGQVVCAQADVRRAAPGSIEDNESKHQHH